MLFNDITINIIENHTQLEYLTNYKITQTYIYENILNTLNIEQQYNNYIIFHTKVRMEMSSITNFIKNDLPLLIIFLKNFKTSKNIIIIGERNLEVKIHNIISIYDELLLLKNNNNVIDLSQDILTSGNSNFGIFYQKWK